MEDNMSTDTERLDFIERMISDGHSQVCEISRRNNNGKENTVEVFTTISQRQRGKTAREVIDIAMEFEAGKRDWKKDSWGKTLAQLKII